MNQYEQKLRDDWTVMGHVKPEKAEAYWFTRIGVTKYPSGWGVTGFYADPRIQKQLASGFSSERDAAIAAIDYQHLVRKG